MTDLRADPAFAEHHARLLTLLRDLSFERRQVVLASGKPSDFYIDCKQAVLSAEGHVRVGHLVNLVLDARAPEVEAVGGLTLGADPLASATATISFQRQRPRHAFIVRKEPKGHGTAQWIEGAKLLRPGMPVAILEDVITTGGSTLKAIERARLAGLDVRHVVAIVDREEEDGRATVEREAPVTALFRRADFLS